MMRSGTNQNRAHAPHPSRRMLVHGAHLKPAAASRLVPAPCMSLMPAAQPRRQAGRAVAPRMPAGPSRRLPPRVA